MLWTATDLEKAPVLVLGKLSELQTTPDDFTVEQPLRMVDPYFGSHLWELKVVDLKSLPGKNLLDGVYHYWFKVKD